MAGNFKATVIPLMEQRNMINFAFRPKSAGLFLAGETALAGSAIGCCVVLNPMFDRAVDLRTVSAAYITLVVMPSGDFDRVGRRVGRQLLFHKLALMVRRTFPNVRLTLTGRDPIFTSIDVMRKYKVATNTDTGAILYNQIVISQNPMIIPEIAAAARVASSHITSEMNRLDAQFPRYGFSKHFGAPSAQHLDAIREYGVCCAHRIRSVEAVIRK